MKSIILNTSKHAWNPFIDSIALKPVIHHTAFEEAVVVDIVINEDHPEYAMDGYNVGAAKVRLLRNNFYRADEKLNWAFPMEANISEYPLIDELVVVYPLLDRMYYTRKLNTSNRPTDNRFFGINKEMQPVNEGKRKIASLLRSMSVPIKLTSGPDTNSSFKNIKSVYRLRHSEGDVIFEGRSGHSIRFGSSWLNDKHFISTTKDQSPMMLFRVGPSETAKKSKPNSPYATVIEDINEDKSSFWMVSDQHIDLNFSTKQTIVHGKSAPDFPSTLDGNQIVINTDRLVMNTKKGKILLNAYDGIHLTSAKNYSLDVDNDYISWINNDYKTEIVGNKLINVNKSYILWSGKSVVLVSGADTIIAANSTFTVKAASQISIMSPKIFVGTVNNTSEPIPLGTALITFLNDFIDAHLQNAATHVMTGLGGPGVLNPAIVSALSKLKQELAAKKIVSSDNFVTKTNQSIGNIPTKLNLH